MTVTSTPVAAADPALIAALADAGLPTSDLAEPGRRFFRLDSEGAAVGFTGLEGEGDDLLVRSVVVLPAHRGRGLGRAIVGATEAEATRMGAARLHLRTTHAAPFFETLAYRRADRNAAPPAIAATAQFASICPGSATYLVKDLTA